MGLYKFNDFKKIVSEVKASAIKEKTHKEFTKFYEKALKKYKANSPSDLNEEEYIAFIESLKKYTSKKLES